MAIVGALTVLIGVNNRPLMAGLLAAEGALKGFGTTAGPAKLAAASLAGVGIVAGLIGIKAIESASKFEDAMTLIETQAGGSREEVEGMTTALLKLAPSVATGPQDLADALYHIESTGHRGADALDILTTSAKLAKIGHAGLEETTNALLAATNSGIGGFTGMSEAAGILNSIVGAGNMRMEELTAAIGSGFLSTAATFGISLQSIGASLATMTAAGLDPVESATKLRMSMSLLGAPTGKAIKQLKTIGLSSTDLANAMRGPDGVLGAIQMLHDHLGNLGGVDQAALLSRAFGGGRSSGAIMALLNLVEQFPIIQQQIIDGSSNLDDAWARTSALASTQWDRIGVSIDVIVKSLGLALIPAVDSALVAIVPLATAFAEWGTDNGQLMSSIVLITGAIGALSLLAIALGPLFTLAGTVMAIALSPVGIVLLGLLGTALSLQAALDKNNALAAQGKTPPESASYQFEHGTPEYQTAAEKHGYGPEGGYGYGPSNKWRAFNTPGFHAGEVGSPYPGPMTPAWATTLPSDHAWNAFNAPGFHAGEVGSPYPGPPTPIQLTNTYNVHLDGAKVAEMIDRRQYNTSSTISSGFAAEPSTVR